MERNDIVRAMRKFVVETTVLVIAFVLIMNSSYLLMTWLMKEVFQIEDGYLRQEFQFLGTIIIALSVLVFILIVTYRRRKRELMKLSMGIEKIANGDYSTKIKYKKRDAMAHVYRDFNKMSAELESVQVLRNDFINNFSHEFRTPIASINGFASLLLEKKYTDEEEKQYLEIIRDESERLSNLASNTILLSKLTSQEIVSDLEWYSLDEQLRQCAILLSQEWMKKQQEFTGDFDKVEYKGNRELMQHLWINLIGNAIKYTPPGGEISMKLRQQDNKAVIVISDTGEGMDSDTLEHLFDPYYQKDRSHSNKGLGLGLSIAKQIVDLCSGTITVNSMVNEGTEFVVTLPLRD